MRQLSPEDDQTVFQAREFLKENRHSMVAIFKRSVIVGGDQHAETQQDLVDLVDCWTLLVEVTGFLEVCVTRPEDEVYRLTSAQYEDQSSLKRARSNMFS
jgi:nuclear pore complex protein Nup205